MVKLHLFSVIKAEIFEVSSHFARTVSTNKVKMFKSLVIIACVCTVGFGAPIDQPIQIIDQPHAHHPVQVVPIVSEDFDNNGDGNFHFG